MLGKEDVWPAETVIRLNHLSALEPFFEGRRHPRRRDRRFHPRPTVQGFSGLFSPCGRCRRLSLRRVEHCVSTFLHLFAPGVTRLLCSYECSDSETVGSSALSSMNTNLTTVPVSLRHVIEPFDHPFPNHRPPSRRAFWVCHVELTGHRAETWAALSGLCVIWASPLEGRLATAVGRIESTCVTG